MKRGSSKRHGRKKNTPPDAASPSSPRCPLLLSWLSKFMKSERNLPDQERDQDGSRLVEGKIDGSPELQRYGSDGEFWRMSFGNDGEKFPPSVSRSCLPVIVEEEEEGAMKFSGMVSSVWRVRELEQDFADIKLNVGQRDGEPNFRAPTEAPRRLPNGNNRESPGGDCQFRRKSPRRTKRRSRHVKVRSPKMNSAVVNVRRSRKGKGGRNRVGNGGERHYEKYAMVKCSYDPQGDFKESMLEMITSSGIGGTATEMEELLACYLILNEDAYHDIIIKVFRQVWFELDRQGWFDHWEESRSPDRVDRSLDQKHYKCSFSDRSWQ
ncbi:hypothetical protein MLD38_016709 [Melastoma candidum]|uniref:Uncharacterized protein n=1 Tax=Melastoma candidum TaxID=119954 RepID=A0ACB9QN67_9MYRT|nr:hypothetical protein MLD38_016709 [Melastoma candidum]